MNYIRVEVFNAKVENRPRQFFQSELEELVEAADVSLKVHRGYNTYKWIRTDFFLYRDGRIFKKIGDRLARIKKEFISKGHPPSIYGEQGLIHE